MEAMHKAGKVHAATGEWAFIHSLSIGFFLSGF